MNIIEKEIRPAMWLLGGLLFFYVNLGGVVRVKTLSSRNNSYATCII